MYKWWFLTGLLIMLSVVIYAMTIQDINIVAEGCGTVSIVLLSVACIFGGSYVKHTNYRYEQEEDTNRRNRIVSILLIMGTPSFIAVAISLFLIYRQ